MTLMQRAIIFVAAASPLYLVRFKIFGLPTTVFELLIIALVVATVVNALVSVSVRASYAQRVRELPRPVIAATVLFIIAGCISVVVAPSMHAALGIWRAYIAEAIAFGLVAWLHLDSYKQFRALGTALSVAAAIVAVVGIVQKFTGWGIPNQFWRAEATRRVTSIFGYPNAVGLYLELVIPFLVAMIVLAKSWSARVWFGSVLIASCAAIIFAESSGTVAALIGTAALFLLGWKRTRWITCAIGVVIIVVVVVSPLRKPFADEFLLQGFSGRLRTQMWSETVEMLKPRWFEGSGLAGYQERVKPYHVFKWAEIYLYPHNLVLTLWSELGTLGLVSFVWIFGLLLHWMLKEIRMPDVSVEHRAWAGVILGTFSIIAIHGLVDTPYFKNDFSALFWVIVAMGLQVRYNRISAKQHS